MVSKEEIYKHFNKLGIKYTFQFGSKSFNQIPKGTSKIEMGFIDLKPTNVQVFKYANEEEINPNLFCLL